MEFRFDSRLHCWTLHRHADVLAAFRDSRFAISFPPVDEASHTYVLRMAMQALTPARIAQWKADLERLPFPVQGGDLVADLAGPWCHEAAMRLTSAEGDAEALRQLAHAVFAAGAEPMNPERKKAGDAAGVELAYRLQGPAAQMGPVAVQAFVAVSQTLAAFLASAWLALLQHPDELERLRSGAAPMAGAIEELLRFAGPSQFQFRYLTAAVENFSPGTRVALAIGAANLDPELFGEDADRLRLNRNASGHLALGAGAHACVGAALVRAAASVAIPRFALASRGLRLVEVRWTAPANAGEGGFAITAPQSIDVA